MVACSVRLSLSKITIVYFHTAMYNLYFQVSRQDQLNNWLSPG